MNQEAEFTFQLQTKSPIIKTKPDSSYSYTRLASRLQNPLKIKIFSRDFVVFPFLDTFEYEKCLETAEMTKSLEIMIFSGDFAVFLFLDTFEYGKCPETGKRQNLLVGPKSLPTGGHRTTLFGKCLETGKQQNLSVGPKSLPTGGHRTTF